ncbi:MAG: bifunctional riboflavin kinase/FAD synthetase [Fimbriiglobus sp.]|jgi:riboflavin kinase/FMN adenylyltransferase|nr:bifunctional riboflavin kinase/FAD synthetase [Fimbriiglobus sp.]
MPTLSLHWMTQPPADYSAGAITVGNFDGVHRGHRELIEGCLAEARSLGGPAVVVTFDPPPLAVLMPTAAKPPLTTTVERNRLLLAAGITRVVNLKTDAGLLALEPEAFFEDVILGLFGAKAVVEGFNFRFGRGRSGDTTELRRLCSKHGIRFREVPPLLDGGEPVSSSRIRSVLQTGDVSAASALLGREYAIEGVVESGAKRGRTIGFPTANLGELKTLTPGNGVYAARATVDGVTYGAAANVGPNPTFGDDARKIEVHLLDFAGDLYGRAMRVQFVKRLRDTRPFSGVTELVEQLRRDVAEARAVM